MGGSALADEPIRLGNGKLLAHAPGIYPAMTKAFAKCGLDVTERRYSSGGEATVDMVAGNLEFVTAGIAPAVRGMAEGTLYTLAVGDLSGGGIMVAVRPDSPIEKPEDLRGKTIAVQSGTGSEVVMQSTVLPSIGLNSGDYEIVDIPADDAIDAIDSGIVDAALVYDPTAAQGVENGKIRVLFDLRAYDIKPLVLLGRRDYVDSHPKESATFLECYLRAMREAQDDPVKLAEVMREQVKEEFNLDLTVDTVRSMLGRVVLQPSFTPDVMATFDADAETQLKAGKIKNLPDMNAYLRLDLLNAALSKAGWDEMRMAHGTVGAHTPLLAAISADAFKEAGVEVVTRRFPTGAEGVKAVINGTVDIGEAGAAPALQAIASGRAALIGVVNLASAFQWVQVAPDSPITTIAELKGKRVAVDVGTSLEQSFTFRVLPMHGLSAADITAVDIRTAKQVDALAAGEVDAILQVEFDASKYVAEGRVRNLASMEGADLQPMLIYASKEAINRNREQLVDVLRGLLWGQDMMRLRPAEVTSLLQSFYAAAGLEYPAAEMIATLQQMTGRIDPIVNAEIVSYLQEQAEELKAAGRLDNVPDWDSAVRNDLMEEAMKEPLLVAQ
jgi:ABC-type nitrate/sulfonate/bicarbonate transport system substrate-binding protein